MTSELDSMFAAAQAGDRQAVARLVSVIERGGDGARGVGARAFPDVGRSHVLGITGPPGAGKSTLTSALVTAMRAADQRVGVLAIDPSSPFTGGAILGDRVRMDDQSLDEGVFIRSMATRGHLGGLALATPGAVRLLDAVGFDWVIVETVGVGQVEIEVARAADTTAVVLNPGWGDAIQASKAGLLEVADLFVVNKADRPGVDDARRDLERMIDLGGPDRWRAPIVATVATDGVGVDELWVAVGDHRRHLLDSGELQEARATRLRTEVIEIVAARLQERAREAYGPDQLATVDADLIGGRLDPWAAADRLLDDQ